MALFYQKYIADTNGIQKPTPNVPQTYSQPAENPTESIVGVKKRPSIRRPTIVPSDDGQLQSIFEKRKARILDPNSLNTFEQAVKKSMESSRAQKDDGKFVKENVGDRGMSSELLKKLQRQKDQIKN